MAAFLDLFDQIKTKVCRDCGEELPLGEFNSHPETRDRKASYCKPCVRLRNAEWYQNRKAQEKTAPDVKVCQRCEGEKPASEFHTSHRTCDGLYVWCKDCRREQWAEEARRLRAAVVALLGGECVACGILDARLLDIDHKDGNGNLERQKGVKQVKLYRKILVEPSPYQLLCCNCHRLKTIADEKVGEGVV